MSTKEHTEEKGAFGFWVYLMSDAVLFAGLFAVYAVLQAATLGGVSVADFADLSFVFIETSILLTSSFVVGLALLAAHRGKKIWTLVALAAVLLLGWCFLGMELNEFVRLVGEGSGPSHSGSLSAFFALVGTHGAHLFFGSLWGLVVLAHVAVRGLSRATVRKLALFSLFWHFLDIIWIFIFTFVYLIGMLAL